MRTFRSFDWLSSISGAKIMAQKPNFHINKKLHPRYDVPSQDKFWPAITQQQIELESCSNPPKTRNVLYLKI